MVINKQDYLGKAHDLLADRDNHKPIPGDPTNRLKKLIQTFRNIKTKGRLNDYKYKRLYLICAVPPKFYRLPKFHKIGAPLGALFPVGKQ